MTSREWISLATTPENHVVVHAAAGTGKTWLLTSRIIRLMLEGVEPGSILAITFTRKAAGEIHQRVTERLLKLASCDEKTLVHELSDLEPSADEDVRHAARGLYETHLSAVQSLRATTFHAFCQEILRRFPLEADVPPGFELLESTAELAATAWSTLDRKMSREKDSPLSQAMDLLLRECGSVDNTRKALFDFLAHRNDWWAYTETASNPVIWATGQLQDLMQVKDDIDPLDDFLQRSDIQQKTSRYSEWLAHHKTTTNLKFIEKLGRVIASQIPSTHAFRLVGEVLLTGEGEPRKLQRSQILLDKLGTKGTDELIRLHEELIADWRTAQMASQRIRTYKVSSAWYLCGEALLRDYQQQKAERGLLDFADLEWMTYRLLKRSHHAEWVQYKLDQRVDHVLVDEFQDTNPTQWRLLLPLLEEMAAGDPERRRSIFLVGDEKQSIYRFRRADPRLFHTARRWLTHHVQAQNITQHHSWRSSPAIIRFVNLVFHRGNENDSDSAEDYRLEDFQPHATHREQLWGHVELLPLIRRQRTIKPDAGLAWRNPLEQPRQTDEDVRYREEGDLIAGKILEWLGKPVAENDVVRPLDADDVMILLRDRTNATYYEDALRRAGIPYIGAGRGAFLESLEIRDLLHLLRILLEPFNDLALASALRSPVFAATESELLRLARVQNGPWRYRLAKVSADHAPGGPLKRAQELLTRWSGYVDRIPVHDLLDRIYNEGNIIARYIAAAPPHLHSRVETNLNRFLELALEVDSGRYPSLSHFLHTLEKPSEDYLTSPGEAAWNRESRVRVMTIHAAKGLESPIVFLVDAARDTGNRERGIRALIEWPVTYSRPKHFHLASKKDRLDDISRAILQEQQHPARREEANLLYVALTRAKQVLYVSGCEPGRGDGGWYNFIEKRLRRVADTAEAKNAGLTMIQFAKGKDAGESTIGAKIEFGDPESLTLNAERKQAESFELDSRLTLPLPPLPNLDTLNPSLTIHAQDNGHDDLAIHSKTRHDHQRRGKIIHRMLEILTRVGDRLATENELRREFADWPEKEVFSNWWQEACGVVDATDLRDFFDSHRYLEARNEIPLLYREGERNIYGIIDRLIIRETEVVLIDYKTHVHATPETMSRLAQDAIEQMRLYGTGVRRLWPERNLRLFLIFTACQGVLEISPNY